MKASLKYARDITFDSSAAKFLLIFLLYAYTYDVIKHYFYFCIKIKINKNLPSPMPRFAELGVEDIASFCFFCNLLSLHGRKSNV